MRERGYTTRPEARGALACDRANPKIAVAARLTHCTLGPGSMAAVPRERPCPISRME
jgi:hypothetical protein